VVAVMALATVAGGSIAHAGTAMRPMGKFKLPYKGSINSSSNALQIGNAGSGNSIEGDSTGSGTGVFGQTNTGYAGVYGLSNVSSPGVRGTSSTGYGVLGSSSSSDGVLGTTTTGYAGVAGSSQQNGVYGYTNGGGSGVYGQNDGSGWGAAGYSASGAGLYGLGGGSNAALALQNGGIRDIGAGVDTATAVFQHVVTSSNTCQNGTYTILDNPYLNDNPNALIFTQTGRDLAFGMGISYSPGGGCPSGKWAAFRADNSAWAVNTSFFVLVIDP